jgi:hypothetical protein
MVSALMWLSAIRTRTERDTVPVETTNDRI